MINNVLIIMFINIVFMAILALIVDIRLMPMIVIAVITYFGVVISIFLINKKKKNYYDNQYKKG